jgi:hypothetical protein
MPLQISLLPNELLDYMRLEPGFDDGPINAMLEGTKLEAEMFLNTDFSTVDENGATVPNEAPASVKEWVLNRVSEKYENRGSFKNPNFSQLQPYRVFPFKG